MAVAQGNVPSIGGYYTTALFWQQDTLREPGDWDPGYWKGTCGVNERVLGVSLDGKLKEHTALCLGTDPGWFPGGTAAVLKLPGDKRRKQRAGDWAPGYWKLECGNGEYVSGLSQSPSNSNYAHAVRCSTDASPSMDTNSCTARAFDSYDNTGDGTGYDWDYGYLKGSCFPGQFVAGVSFSRSYRPHSILCCDVG